MMRIFHGLMLIALANAFVLLPIGRADAESHDDAVAKVIRSAGSGRWSEPETWQENRVPRAGDRVLILAGHRIDYDVCSDDVIRGICISGSLSFSTKCNTLLNVGLIRIEAGNTYSEDGFDCLHATPDVHDASKKPPHEAAAKPALLIGTPTRPIPKEFTATVRLHYIAGMDRETCPAIVCCGGRMDVHGAPLERTWVKLVRTADAGATRLSLERVVPDWNVGDKVLITGSGRQEPSGGRAAAHVKDLPASEVRTIRRLSAYGAREIFGSPQLLELDAPLERTHVGGEEYRVEVANLSRNVVVESAAPDGVRGHTMYHRDSAGSISYAEFRHLGKRGVLGKYPIHYHLVGDTMRGSSVVGVSIWDSHNRWVTIHGTQYLVVRDCIGYQSVGHGFFLEDGTEVFNVLDRNLAVQAMIGEPLPKQALPFDLNDGAGFWWANSLNAFTRNVAVECDQHGFRFEAVKTDRFDPALPVRQPDGSEKRQDIRTLPFLCFDDNEAHCQRRFGLNLGGIRGMTYATLHDPERRSEYFPLSIGGSVDGVGPDRRHPFQIRNMKVWDTHWAFHSGAPAVSVDGLDVFDCNYGIWRSVIDLHQYDNLRFRQIHGHAIFFPTGGHGPDIHLEDGRPSYPATDPVDDLPPITVITRIQRTDGGMELRGVTADNGVVRNVYVNGRPVAIGRQGVSEWSLVVPGSAAEGLTFTASSEDAAGNVEQTPHRRAVPASVDQNCR